MNDGRVTVWVGEREALPVRAIPYVTSWQESPDSIVRALSEPATIKVAMCQEIRNKQSLVAYVMDGGGHYEQLPASQWKDSAVALRSLTKKLMADEREEATDENYGPWRVAAILKLPDNAFVWLDEFQAWYSITRPTLHREGDSTRLSALQAARESTDSGAQRLDDLEAEIFQTASAGLCLTPILPPEIEGNVWRYIEAALPAAAAERSDSSYANFEFANDEVIRKTAFTVHRIVNRTNILKSVIRQAIERAAPPKDTPCVWAELVRLAESKDRPAPLLGFADGEGVKYQDSSGVKFLTRKNLGDRMRRAKAR